MQHESNQNCQSTSAKQRERLRAEGLLPTSGNAAIPSFSVSSAQTAPVERPFCPGLLHPALHSSEYQYLITSELSRGVHFSRTGCVYLRRTLHREHFSAIDRYKVIRPLPCRMWHCKWVSSQVITRSTSLFFIWVLPVHCHRRSVGPRPSSEDHVLAAYTARCASNDAFIICSDCDATPNVF